MKFRTQLIIYFSVFSILISGTILIFFSIQFQEFSRDKMIQYGQILSDNAVVAFSDYLIGESYHELQEAVAQFQSLNNVTCIRVINISNQIIAASDESMISSPAELDSIKDGYKVDEEKAEIFFMKSVELFGQQYGRICLIISLEEMMQEKRRIQLWGIMLAAGFWLFAFVFSFLAANRLSMVMNRMMRVTDSVAKGDFNEKATGNGIHEFEKLSEALNLMSEVIQYRDQEQLENRNEIEKVRSLLNNVLNSMPSAIIAIEKEGRVILFNKEAENLTGVKYEELESKAIFEIIPSLLADKEKLYETMTHGSIEQDRKLRLKTSEDIEKLFDVTIYPIVTASSIQGAVIRFDDVTEKTKLENMLVQNEKMLSIGGLAAGMAHEINNPLAGILQSLQVSLNRLNPERKINLKAAEKKGIDFNQVTKYIQDRGLFELLDSARSSAVRASEIVKNMLSFSRKSDSSKPIEIELQDLLEKTIEIVRSDFSLNRQFDFKKVKIIKEYAEGIPLIKGEPAKLQQVFLNLMRNGAQAMALAGVKEPELKIELFSGLSQVCIKISDNGPGIEEDLAKRVFEPFFTTKQPGEGTGLGLSVSYFIITETHGGNMSLEGRPGKGARFVIELPVRHV